MCSAKPGHSNTQQEINFLGRPVGPHNCTVELLSFWMAAFAVSCITFGRDLKGKVKRSEKMVFSITPKTQRLSMLRNLHQHLARKKQSEYLKLVPPKLVADNTEMFLQEY